jgi:nucleotide-binding universal stress UspA family protein
VAETKSQAIERSLAEREDYLLGLVARLPVGPTYNTEAHVSPSAADTIIARARALRSDVIVMATHGYASIAHHLFGGTTEQVVRSGVAPVLLVHPEVRRGEEESLTPDDGGEA